MKESSGLIYIVHSFALLRRLESNPMMIDFVGVLETIRAEENSLAIEVRDGAMWYIMAIKSFSEKNGSITKKSKVTSAPSGSYRGNSCDGRKFRALYNTTLEWRLGLQSSIPKSKLSWRSSHIMQSYNSPSCSAACARVLLGVLPKKGTGRRLDSSPLMKLLPWEYSTSYRV